MLSPSEFRRQITRREIYGILFIGLAYLAVALSFPQSTLIYRHHSQTQKQHNLPKQKILFLIIDGMGAQFTFRKEQAPDSMPKTTADWENKMTVFEDLALKEPQNAMHKRSVICPPTWTVDRISSLMTGGYPSQSLSDSMFGTYRTDNLIEDIPSGPNIFLGDVIWRPLIDFNPHVNFTRTQYFNFFSSGEGVDQSDTSVINTTINVSLFKAVFEEPPGFQFLDGSHL